MQTASYNSIYTNKNINHRKTLFNTLLHKASINRI